MTQALLLWVIGLTALLVAPAAMLAFAVFQHLAPWLRRQLPTRHLVGRGWRRVAPHNATASHVAGTEGNTREELHE